MNASMPELAQTLFEEAGDALFLFDPDTGRIVDVNPTAQRFCEAGRPALVAEAVETLFRSEQAGGVRRLQRAYRTTGQFHAQDGFFLRQRAAGTWLPVNLTVARLHARPKTLGLITARDVSERRRAEAALRENEARHRAVLESALDCIITVDHHGTVIEFNPAAERTFGYPRAAAVGRPVADLIIPPADRAAHNQGLARFRDTGKWAVLGRRIEVSALRADGSPLPVELTVTAVRSDGPPVFTAFLRDLTEQKRAEAAARRAGELLRAVADGTTDAVFVKDRAGKYLLFNEAAGRFVGRPPAEVVGRDDTELFDPASAQVVMDRDRRVMESGVADTAEENLTAAGVTRTYLATKAPYRDAAGHVVGLIGISRDISERKQAERAIRESEERFRALIEMSFDGILLLDRDGVVTYASPAATGILGYAREELVGRSFFDFVPREDLDEHAARHRRVVGEPGTSVPSCNRYRHKDGGWRWLEVRSTNLFAEPGVRAKVINFRDVTEQRRLEEQYRQAQKMDAIGRLAGGVAHDFNNLLTIINGYSDLLLQALPAADPSRESLELIHRAGERSAALTRQLLAFSRQQVLAPRILDLNTVIADTEKMLRRMIGEDVDLATALAPDLGPVLADAGQIEQTLLNLAVNARDAMPTGGRLTIETRNVDLDETFAQTHPAVRPGPHVLLAVSDTGCGMTDDVKARVFEPFFTTKGPGKGTGLGLATVYGIVRQSGGHVGVYSEAGVGTTFKVYLPRVATAAGPAKVKSGLLAPPPGTETVLLVEDESGVRALARHVLKRCGYSLIEAADGDEAVRVAAEHPGTIDLLITDVVMPGRGGQAVAECVAGLHPRVRVLFVSGYTDDAVVRHGVLQDRVNFLQKPFPPVALAHKVREVLDAPATEGRPGPAAPAVADRGRRTPVPAGVRNP